MNNFEEKLAHCLDYLEESRVKEAMIYSLCAPGKRFRPLLLYSVLKGYGVNVDQGDKTAIAIEMIHSYSLIHDDLPCMDDDDLRRGRKTCHKQFDEATALLAGDALLSEAFGFIANATYNANLNNDLVNEFVKAIGANGMILGQMIDLLSENTKVDLETIEKIDYLKTGCLFSLALVSGCIIADRKADIDVWRNVGFKLGLAFQIQDDCLDVTGDEATLGKSISDEKNQKTTFVTELGYDEAKALYTGLFEEIENDIKKINVHEEPFLSLVELVKNRNH